MHSIDKTGDLLVVCGLSGSGKSTLARHALSTMSDLIEYLNTFTTRPRRQGEDGIEYTFVSDQEYDQAKNQAVLWDESVIYDNRYGADAGAYIRKMEQGKNIIVCTTPSNAIVDEMREIYRHDRVKTIHLQTNPELSGERMQQRDLQRNLGRIAVDAALHAEEFHADYSLSPTGLLSTDKDHFINLIRSIIS